jgi:cobalt-zinc-cadmium efflux system membrane fusion protein
VIGGAALVWSMGFIGFGDHLAGRSEAKATAAEKPGDSKPSDESSVDLSERQAKALKIDAVGSRDFILFKTAVGTIDFNENLLVQVFSQYPGKIIERQISTSG